MPRRTSCDRRQLFIPQVTLKESHLCLTLTFSLCSSAPIVESSTCKHVVSLSYSSHATWRRRVYLQIDPYFIQLAGAKAQKPSSHPHRSVLSGVSGGASRPDGICNPITVFGVCPDVSFQQDVSRMSPQGLCLTGIPISHQTIQTERFNAKQQQQQQLFSGLLSDIWEHQPGLKGKAPCDYTRVRVCSSLIMHGPGGGGVGGYEVFSTIDSTATCTEYIVSISNPAFRHITTTVLILHSH